MNIYQIMKSPSKEASALSMAPVMRTAFSRLFTHLMSLKLAASRILGPSSSGSMEEVSLAAVVRNLREANLLHARTSFMFPSITDSPL